MKIKLVEYIADFMVEKGVSHCFTVTGGGAMHLNDAFGHKEGLTCVYNHHEQGSAIAAEGYARMTGRLPLLCVTSGPGGTNALTGVVGSWLDSIPMFVISGQVKRQTTVAVTELPLRQVGDQEYPIVRVAKHMSKYAIMVMDAQKIAYYLEKAWFLATNGRCGPVWLDIPLDIQSAMIETESLEHYDSRYDDMRENPVYDVSLTGKVLKKIKNAKRPVILAGEGIRMSGAQEDFLRLAEKLRIPVVTAWNAHDLVPDENECYCGRPGTIGNRGGNFVVQNSDLLISVGCRLNIRQISYTWELFAKNAYKVMVDIDPAEMFKHTLQIDLPIYANAKDFIASMLGQADDFLPWDHSEWMSWARKINMKYSVVKPEYYDQDSPVNPYVFISELFDRLPEGANIVTGNGSSCVISFQAGKIKPGQRLFTNSGNAAMGYGLPAAFGAAIGTGGRVICIDGDGSIMMNLQELQTISHHKSDIKIFLINNKGYHSCRQTQTNLFGERPMVGVGPESGDLSFPEFGKVAAAFDIPYYSISTRDEIEGAVKCALADKGPALCEIFVEPWQFFEPKLSSRVLPDGSIESPEIDDLFPFLPREEYAENKLG